MNRALNAIGPGFWACAGAVVLLAAATSMIGLPAGAALAHTAFAFAAFYLVVGVGQMLVITSGPGNIDLSIPAVMTLAGYLAMGQMRGHDAGLISGLALGVAVGLAAGLANAVLIFAARIPPMIATLASGFIVQSFAIAYSRGSTARPARSLAEFSMSSALGLPAIAWLGVLLAAVAAVVLRYTTFGRSVEAIGQNRRAARFAAVPVLRTMVAVYLISALLAAFAGVLFASYSGGASLGMAEDFLLVSIAVVVVGGTNVAGGRASVLGLIGASVFLYLAITVLNIFQFSPGIRSILTGSIIIGVLCLTGPGRSRVGEPR
jgi:ribose transport system permease protein